MFALQDLAREGIDLTFTAPEWVLIITAICTGLTGLAVSIINAIRGNQTKKIVEEGIRNQLVQTDLAHDKLSEIKSIANGNLERMKQDLLAANRRNAHLEKVISLLADKCEPGSLKTIMEEAEEKDAAIQGRRKQDFIRKEDER